MLKRAHPVNFARLEKPGANHASVMEAYHTDIVSTVEDEYVPHLPLHSKSFHVDVLRCAKSECVALNGTTYAEPPCGNGENCVCLLPELGGPGGLVCRAMPRTIFELENERQTGMIASAGMCLLCKRNEDSIQVVQAIQTQRPGAPPCILQDHFVRTDPGCKESYLMEHCFDPKHYAHLGLYLPILTFDVKHYGWVQREDGEWYVDQSRLDYPPS